MLALSLLTVVVLAGPLDFPLSTEICDADGWCVPMPGWQPNSHAADGNALVVASGAGYVAVFVDEQWRSAHRVPKGTSVAQVEKTESNVRLLLCVNRSCSWRTWQDGALGEPEAAIVKEPAQKPGLRSGTPENGTEWKRVNCALMLKTAQGWRDDSTCFSPTAHVDAFSVGPRPFWPCWGYTAGSLAHFDGERVVTVHDVWATHWAGPRLSAFEEVAGCAPCLLSGDHLLHRDGTGWHLLGRTGSERDVHAVAVIDRVYIKSKADIFAWNGSAWEPASYEGPWSHRLELGRRESARMPLYWVTSERLLLSPGAHELEFRRWADFETHAAAKKLPVKVYGVARDDVLHARRLPTSTAALVESLAPDASCLTALDTGEAEQATGWSLIRLPSGKAAWVNARYLRPQRTTECAVP